MSSDNCQFEKIELWKFSLRQNNSGGEAWATAPSEVTLRQAQ
jgi:hypothetical protein